MKKLVVIFCLISQQILGASEPEIYPPNWFKGMNDTCLQIIVRYENIRDAKLNMKTNIVKVSNRYPCANPNFIMLDLLIPRDYKANYIPIEFEFKKKKKLLVNYPLLEKPKGQKKILQGNDLLYLIMPDRFANGDPNNDAISSLNENTVDRKEPFARHGGDLKGIEQHIDYMQKLGVTTVWLTPFFENNEPKQSYHGYAITNHYKSDPRICSNEQYKYFVNNLHSKNMKVCIDMVFNHIGDQHWIYKEMPFPNWIHKFDTFTRTNYRANTLMDPYASANEKKQFTEGWFDHHMPDLNTDDPNLARYLVQNTLWWLMYADIDAIRIDTYSYPELSFMQSWHRAIRKEFPDMSIFGEIWEHVVPLQSYFTPSNKSSTEAMQNVLDFQFCFAMNAFVQQDFGWTEGVSKLYYVLTQDYLYKDPFHHVTFIDNHDLDRFLGSMNGDVQKLRAALGVLLTMRGIPCLFYGTEMHLQGKGNDGVKREDFKGGWAADPIDKFNEKNWTEEEKTTFQYISKIQKWKKSHDAFQEHGKMMQFIPKDGLYMYARYSEKDAALIIYNSAKKSQRVPYEKFQEISSGYSNGKNPVDAREINLRQIELAAGELLIIDLEK